MIAAATRAARAASATAMARAVSIALFHRAGDVQFAFDHMAGQEPLAARQRRGDDPHALRRFPADAVEVDGAFGIRAGERRWPVGQVAGEVAALPVDQQDHRSRKPGRVGSLLGRLFQAGKAVPPIGVEAFVAQPLGIILGIRRGSGSASVPAPCTARHRRPAVAARKPERRNAAWCDRPKLSLTGRITAALTGRADSPSRVPYASRGARCPRRSSCAGG